MEPLHLSKVVEVTEGQWVADSPLRESLVAEVSTDTRTLAESSVFVALQGDRFDGHAFVGEARRRGAIASVVCGERIRELPPSGRPYIGVVDPLEALERIACWNRRRLRLSVVGVTGSVGKTSTKEFITTILSDAFRVKSAPKSFNNRIGVAVTLISATTETEVLVVEMGASAPGELAHLSCLVRPHRIVLTEIAPAHLEGFGDIDGVVSAKSEVFDGLEAGGTSFIRHGVYGFERFVLRTRGPLRTFGWGEGDHAVTDCRRVSLGQDARSANGSGDYGYLFTLNGTENFLLPVPGRHNVLNATAAIAVARDLGMSFESIRSSLAACRLPPQRLHVHTEGGIVFVDDTYNASPASMASAIDEWLSLGDAAGEAAGAGGGRVAVIGDMLEMGSHSGYFHERVGKKLASVEARLIVTVGCESQRIGEVCRASGSRAEIVHLDSAAAATSFLKERLRPGDCVLFKASRRIGLDGLAVELRKWFGGKAEG